MFHNMLAAVLTAILGRPTLAAWRHEPDPATADDPEPQPDDDDDDDTAIAAGLVMAGGLDGFEAVYAAQAAMLQARIDRTLTREYWHNPPANTALN